MAKSAQLAKSRLARLQVFLRVWHRYSKPVCHAPQASQPMASLCQREIHVPSAALLPLPDQCRCDAHSDKKSGAMVNNLHGERAGLFLSCRETFCSVEAHSGLDQ